MRRAALWIGLIGSLSVAVPAHAWNKPGHMVSASLAYRDLKRADPAKAAAWVAILKKHEHFDQYWKPVLDAIEPGRRDEALFMLAARWPDDVRDQPLARAFHRAVWHFADHPLKLAGTPAGVGDGVLHNDLRSGETDEGFNNLLEALPHNLTIVRDATADDAARAKALCWVLHLTGDMHQPLHMVSRFSEEFPKGDRGGNDTFIVIPPGTTSLKYHSFWDGLVLRGRDDRLVRGNPAAIARGIVVASRRAAVLAARRDLERGDFPQLATSEIKDWAKESVAIAASVAYLDGVLTGGEDDQDPFEVPDGFSALAQDVAEHQVALAGFRISDLLAH